MQELIGRRGLMMAVVLAVAIAMMATPGHARMKQDVDGDRSRLTTLGKTTAVPNTLNRSHRVGNRRGVRDIEPRPTRGPRPHCLAGSMLGSLVVDVGTHHVGARRDEGTRKRGADSRTGAGDDGLLAAEIDHASDIILSKWASTSG